MVSDPYGVNWGFPHNASDEGKGHTALTQKVSSDSYSEMNPLADLARENKGLQGQLY